MQDDIRFTLPQDKPKLFYKRMRRDGKIPCKYVFSSGKSFNHLLTPDKLEAEKASGQYEVFQSSY